MSLLKIGQILKDDGSGELVEVFPTEEQKKCFDSTRPTVTISDECLSCPLMEGCPHFD